MQLRNLLLASLASMVHGQDLTTALMDQPMLSNLTTYLGLFPSLASSISGMSNITLLAPSNEAFTAALDTEAGRAFSSSDVNTITALLQYHVLNGSYDNFTNMPEFIPTALMPGMYANVTGGQVVEALSIGNGSNATTTFFSGLLANSTVATNGTVTFDGGVVHIIDQFLTIPSNISNTAVQLNLRSAVGALTAANLVETIDTTPDITCFIPDNAAFQAIGVTLANASPENLTRILEYHAVNGSVLYSTDIMNGTTLTSLNGLELTVTTEMDDNGTEVVYINSARVLTPNVLVANGVIHVIDNVLNPENATAAADADEPAFSGASSATDEPFTSGVATATTTVYTEGPADAQASATGGSSGESSSSSDSAAPMVTAGMGAAALFGGAAALMNL